MIAYGYDDNGYYTNPVDAPIDPLETQKAGHEVYILPANATYEQPLEPKEGFRVRFVDNMWIYEAIPEPEPEPEPEPHVPTKEEQEQARAWAYQAEVDPITSHISRLRDEEQTEEIIADIEALKAERAEKVEEIKQRYPYPTDPIYVDELEESANEEVEESSEEVSE